MPRTWMGLVILLGLLSACGEKEPIRIGFIGGLSGRFADLGTPGRNGATLAVELRNQQGGIGGRKVELLIRDDQQDPEVAKKGVDDLLAHHVKAIIGPMTSSIAVVVVPAMNDARVLMMGATVTTVSLSGRDDYFYRVVGTTATYASHAARYHYERLGLRKAALALDVANLDYTESWVNEYAKTFESLGGKVVARVPFDSRADKSYLGIAGALLEAKPEIVALACSSVDGALIAQNLRKLDKSVRLAGAGWAATERLTELGGQAVEGMLVEQYFDRFDESPRYKAFHKAFFDRFGQEPGFAGTTAYDAALAVFAALEKDPSAKDLKKALAEMKRFPGVQGDIVFDEFGDASRSTYLNEVSHGQFVPVR